MSKQNYPPGWDEERVRAVLAHYENQTEDARRGQRECVQFTDA